MTVGRIEDYALIGDCRSAALVSRTGSIDWLCWPRFDSPSIFAAILDERAGHWWIRPAGPFRSERRYVGDTNVLETRFLTEGGSLSLVDLMPVASEEDKHRVMLADHEILRVARCDEGTVEIEVEFAPRPDYGRYSPRIELAGKQGARVALGAALLLLRGDLDLRPDGTGTLVGRTVLSAGNALHFSLTFAEESMAVLPPLGAWSFECIARSVAWWTSWASRTKYDGPWRDVVVRSALALRLMLYAPSGAFVAAPTTSLPERLGGDKNWDYRFCWLRDASLTMRALFGLGHREEAEAFLSWLLHSTRLTRPALRALYDVFGRVPRPERVLEHLAGYGGSRPVRVGNGATDQLQLDVYGDVLDATAQFVRQGGKLDRETCSLLRGFGEYVRRKWRCPDEGIWEPRSGRRQNTHSKVLCWVALDRLLELHDANHIRLEDAPALAAARDEIRREVEQRAYNRDLGSYVSTLDGSELDASTLLFSWYGFEDAASERMRSTYARVKEDLGAGRGLLYRYRSPEPLGEGAFAACGFWAADYLALGGGSAEEARASFEDLIDTKNDVGLFAEEIDPATGAALGNFPQAFSHLGLINAALSLNRRLEQAKPMVRGPSLQPAQVARPSGEVRPPTRPSRPYP